MEKLASHPSPATKRPRNAVGAEWREFIIIFLPIAALLTAVFIIYHSVDEKSELIALKAADTRQVEMGRNGIEHDLSGIAADLMIIANYFTILAPDDDTDENDGQAWTILANEFFVYRTLKKYIDQVRFIDRSGKEIVRVDYNGGAPAIAPLDQLQDKSGHYYFRKTFDLPRGEIFVSPMDLNVERGKVEEPFKPAIRLGTPAFDRWGRKRGIVLLNYLAGGMIEGLLKAMRQRTGEAFLINRDGYWLSSPRKEDEWGFMFGKQRTLAEARPEVWRHVTGKQTGQFLLGKELFTFETVYHRRYIQSSIGGSGLAVAAPAGDSDANIPYWKIVLSSNFGHEHFIEYFSHSPRFTVFWAALIALSGMGSWLLAGARVSKRDAAEALKERTKLVQLLHTVTIAANEASNLEEAMRSCIDDICIYNGWPVGHVYELSPGSPDVLVPASIWHLDDPERFAAFREATEKTGFRKGVGLPGRVLASGRSVWIADVTKDPDYSRVKMAGNINIGAGFALPVLKGDEVVAVLEFFSATFAEPDELLLQTLDDIGKRLGHVAERNQSLTALGAAKDKAEFANRAKTEFLANTSHELRTPLTAVIGFSDLIVAETFGPIGIAQYLEYARDINHSGKRLLNVINNILEVSQIDARDQTLNESRVNVPQMVASCIDMVGAHALDASLTLEVAAAQSLPGLYADKRRLKQILLYLLSNAIKFTPEGGTVTLEAAVKEDGCYMLSVADTGIGIAPGDIEMALSTFGQADGSLTRKYEGIGLGLPLSKRYAELHGGRLILVSEPGIGTTVSVYFPAERVIGGDFEKKDTHGD